MDKKKKEDWNGLYKAIKEAYPEDPNMADKVCSGKPDSVYRYVSQILCANQNRSRRIMKLSDALLTAVEELRRLSERASDAADDANEAAVYDELIGKVVL